MGGRIVYVSQLFRDFDRSAEVTRSVRDVWLDHLSSESSDWTVKVIFPVREHCFVCVNYRVLQGTLIGPGWIGREAYGKSGGSDWTPETLCNKLWEMYSIRTLLFSALMYFAAVTCTTPHHCYCSTRCETVFLSSVAVLHRAVQATSNSQEVFRCWF